MNTLSLAANIIAVITAVSSTSKTLKELVKERKAPDQVLQLVNEISDLHIILVVIQRTCDEFGGSEPLIINHLKGSVQKAKNLTSEIDAIIKKCIYVAHPETTTLNTETFRILWKHWIREKKKIHTLTSKLRCIRTDLNTDLTVLTSSQLPRIRTDLREINAYAQSITTTLETHHRTTRTELEDLAKNIGTITSNGAPLATSHSIPIGSSTSVTPFLIDGCSHTETPLPSPRFHLQTSIYETQQCPQLCTCTCHTITKLNTPSILRHIFGLLFIGYSSLPFPFPTKSQNTPCTETSCRKTNRRHLVTASYYFPSWFLRRAVMVRESYNPLSGLLLSVRAPRVMDSEAAVFRVAREGSVVGIKKIFYNLSMGSPYDVGALNGMSVLHYAVLGKHFELCEFLLASGANGEYEDFNGMSCIDYVWNHMLVDASSDTTVSLKRVFQRHLDLDEGLQRRKFTTLHKVVLGFSSLSLRSVLQTSTAEINNQCSMRRTPLIWAILLSDTDAVRTLLEHGADIYSPSIENFTAFHHAAECESHDISRLLIEKATGISTPSLGELLNWEMETITETLSHRTRSHQQPDFCSLKTARGSTPFHILCNLKSKTNIPYARLLLACGVDINCPNDDGFPPLILAIQSQRKEMISFLLENGARTDVKDREGMGILHHAAFLLDAEALEMLIRLRVSGVDVNDKMNDRNGMCWLPLEGFDTARQYILHEDQAARAVCREILVRLLEGIARGWDVEGEREERERGGMCVWEEGLRGIT